MWAFEAHKHVFPGCGECCDAVAQCMLGSLRLAPRGLWEVWERLETRLLPWEENQEVLSRLEKKGNYGDLIFFTQHVSI